MKKSYKPEKNDRTETRDYRTIVNQCEGTYGQKLSDDVFNLGAEISKNEKCWGIVQFCPKTWTAWMRRAKLHETPEAFYIGLEGNQAQFWIERIFQNFHSMIARHKNKKVLYRLGGETLDLAGYGTKAYPNLTQEQQDYATACFAEARANVRSFVQKGKDAFKQ